MSQRILETFSHCQFTSSYSLSQQRKLFDLVSYVLLWKVKRQGERLQVKYGRQETWRKKGEGGQGDQGLPY